MANEIFHYMKQIEKGNYQFFLGLTDEEVKAVPPFQLLMWSQGSSLNRDVMVSMADQINYNFFQFHQYPKLQYLLLTSAVSDIPQGNLKFRKPNMGGGGTKTLKAISEQFHVSLEVASTYVDMLGAEDVTYIVELYDERQKNEPKTNK